MSDFVIGMQFVVQDIKGLDILHGGQEMLSAETIQMIMEDIAEYLNREASDEWL